MPRNNDVGVLGEAQREEGPLPLSVLPMRGCIPSEICMSEEQYEMSPDGIFTVTVITRRDSPSGYRQRVWGFERSFELAEEKVLGNVSDLFEFLYLYAVIEHFNPGVPSWGYGGKICGWYKANYGPEGVTVEKLSAAPEEYERSCGFGMG